MLWPKKQMQPDLSIACTLSETGYSLAVTTQKKHVLFSQSRTFDDNTLASMAITLTNDVDRFNLTAQDCQLILLPGQYQLILMDALEVPEADMAKALRWSLKGLSDYDLDDVAIDAFMLPSTNGDSQKKTMVAITPQSILNKQCATLESAFLNVTTVSIAEMALKNLVTLMFPSTPEEDTPPLLVISLYGKIRKLHIFYNNMLYLVRALSPVGNPIDNEPAEMTNIILELERSIDYCVNKLNLTEPKQILFTPGFYQSVAFFKVIEETLTLTASIIDLNQYLEIEPALSLEDQHEVFYSITGAIRGTSA